MTDRIRQLARRLVTYMDQQNYVLQDTDAQTKPIPQDLLRAFRNAVYTEMQEPPRKNVLEINQSLEDIVREYQQP